MNETKFIKGLFVNKPSEKAPEYVKAKMSISADTFIPFLKENVNGKGYMNFDLLESKEGKLYVKLDTYQPTPNATFNNENKDKENIDKMFDEASNQDEIKIEDIPF